MAITTSKTGPATTSTKSNTSKTSSGVPSSLGGIGSPNVSKSNVGKGGQGGVSGGGGSKSSPAGSKSNASGVSKSSSPSKSTTSSGSKAPNAAAAAASAKLNSTKAPTAQNNQSKAPNAAAANASRLNAAKTALSKVSPKTNTQTNTNTQNKGGSTSPVQAKSIQGMINSMTPSERDARLNAITRGPGPSAGLGYASLNTPDKFKRADGTPTAEAFRRTAISYTINEADRRGITDPKRINAMVNNITQFSDVAFDPEGVRKAQKSLGYTPVGIRSKNPGNLLTSAWQKEMPGYAGTVKSPNGLTYSSYTDPRWGLVAQNELLGRYADGGRNTIRSVVDRYAPTDENNSAAANRAYKQHLSNATGWGLDTPLSREQVMSLGPVKTSFENGANVLAGGPFGSSGLNVAREAKAPRPVPRPLQSFVGGDPRAAMQPGAFPGAAAAPFSDAGVRKPATPFAVTPQAFSDAGVRRPTAPFVAPQQPFSDAGVRRPTAPFTPSGPTSPQIATDPRVNMPPGSYPQPGNTPPGYFQQFAMTPQDMEGLKKQAMKDFSFGELMEMRKNQQMLPGFMGPFNRDTGAPPVQQAAAPIPTARPPVQGPPRPVGGMSFTPGLPARMPTQLSDAGVRRPTSPYSPQERVLGVENFVQGDISRNPYDMMRTASPIASNTPPSINDMGVARPVNPYSPPSEPPFRKYANEGLPPGYADRYFSPQVTSENPIQGPSNPSQEPENPQDVEKRRADYSKKGGMIGGVIAGPVGAIVGAVLGDQLGKTKPGQRQQIANDPAALRANVNSINRLVEMQGLNERSGERPTDGRPINAGEMRVTEAGFRDVLTDPKKVLDNPEDYTNLEEMLAALAAGVDPATGKPIEG